MIIIFLYDFQADANYRSLPPQSNSTHDKSVIVSKPQHTVSPVPSASDKKREATLDESEFYHCVDSYNDETQENIGLHTENLIVHYAEVTCEGVSV